MITVIDVKDDDAKFNNRRQAIYIHKVKSGKKNVKIAIIKIKMIKMQSLKSFNIFIDLKN